MCLAFYIHLVSGLYQHCSLKYELRNMACRMRDLPDEHGHRSPLLRISNLYMECINHAYYILQDPHPSLNPSPFPIAPCCSGQCYTVRTPTVRLVLFHLLTTCQALARGIFVGPSLERMSPRYSVRCACLVVNGWKELNLVQNSRSHGYHQPHLACKLRRCFICAALSQVSPDCFWHHFSCL